jgi:hypothetical protein
LSGSSLSGSRGPKPAAFDGTNAVDLSFIARSDSMCNPAPSDEIDRSYRNPSASKHRPYFHHAHYPHVLVAPRSLIPRAMTCARRDARVRCARRYCQVVLDQKRRGGSDHGLVNSGRRCFVHAVPTPRVETVPALRCPVGSRVTKRPVSESTSEALGPRRGSTIEGQGPHAIEHDR